VEALMAETTTISPRQREVLVLLAEGQSQKKIAAILGISPHTVHNHLAIIYGRIDAQNGPHAIFILRHILTT
jgi:DNA-binding CsgD family transcriptional regulator